MVFKMKSAQGYLFNTTVLVQNKNDLALADAPTGGSPRGVALHNHTFLTWLVVWSKNLPVAFKFIRLDLLLHLLREVAP